MGSVKSLQRCKLEGLKSIEINCSTLWWMLNCSWHQASLRDGSCPVLDRYNVWHVLWAMHSSLEELEVFTRWIRPRTIRGTCPCFGSLDCADFTHLLWESESQSGPRCDVLRVYEESEESQESPAGDLVSTPDGAQFVNQEDWVSPLAGDTLDMLVNSDSFTASQLMRTDPHERDLLLNSDSFATSAVGNDHQQWKTLSKRWRSDSEICCINSDSSTSPASSQRKCCARPTEIDCTTTEDEAMLEELD